MHEGKVNIGLLGLGNVGEGVYRNIKDVYDPSKTGLELNIAKVYVRDKERDSKGRERKIVLPNEIFTSDPNEILRNPEIDVIVEVMGGLNPAEEYMVTALENDKHVVTANKAVLAQSWKTFLAALTHKKNLGFEASVCGELPVIDYISQMTGKDIVALEGIINGTSNYILTRMHHKGLDYAHALKEAQDKGFAEADPSFDVDGADAAQKLAILSTLAFGHRVEVSQISTESIRDITLKDIEYAKELGYVIKPMALAKRHDGGVLELRVSPVLVKSSEEIAHVDHEKNTVSVYRPTRNVPLTIGGLGAGMMPTASAVVDDIVRVAKNPFESRSGIYNLFTCPLVDFSTYAGNFESAYYLRLTVDDTPGVLAAVSNVLANHHINIEDVSQKGKEKDDGLIPMVMLSSPTKEEKIQKALSAIRGFDFVKEALAIRRKV